MSSANRTPGEGTKAPVAPDEATGFGADADA
jgi:hypothetical protein